MEIDRHHVGDAQQEIVSLKGRVARALSVQIAAKHEKHGVFSATVTDRHAPQIEQLLVSQSDLRRQLRDSEEELEAARRLTYFRE